MTSDQLVSAQLELAGVEQQFASQKPDAQTRYTEETREQLRRQVTNQELLERFRARRALIIWSLILTASAILWLTHWRMLRGEAAA